MKNYSINDLKKGDIYEHFGGGWWMVKYINTYAKKITSIRVNDINETQEHSIDNIRTVCFLDS